MNRKRIPGTMVLLLAGTFAVSACRGPQERNHFIIGLAQGPQEQNHLIISPAHSENSSGLSISSGILSFHEHQIGVVLGPTVFPSARPGPRYLLLIKHKMGEMKLPGVTNKIGTQNRIGFSDVDLVLDGVTLSTRYKATLKGPYPGTVSETLRFNDKPVKLTEGGVFLVEIQGSGAVWKQVKAPVPPLFATADSSTIEALAPQGMEQAAQQSPVVRDFLR